MTIGERIAQRRKELGLSQEALGERMGVSRQAIYKWESDAALPEIEKLVKLAREFGVSVGWLLGEEDNAPEKRELTPEQLRMVEEIVGRYLEARRAEETASDEEEQDTPEALEEDPEQPPKRRRWPYVLAGLALVVVAGAFSNLFMWVNELQYNLQNLRGSMSVVQEQLSGTNQGMAEMLKQNSLTMEQSAEITGTDYWANTITVSARAVPRTYVEGMTVEFFLTSAGETITVPGEQGDDCSFTATVTGPLSDDIEISAAFLANGRRTTLRLDQFKYMYSKTFPNLLIWDELCDFGEDVVNEYTYIPINESNAALISDIRLGLFRDRKVVAWYKRIDRVPPVYADDPSIIDPSECAFFQLDGEWKLEPGHEYCQGAVVLNQYHQEKFFPGPPYSMEGDSLVQADFDYRTYYDPAGWEY